MHLFRTPIGNKCKKKFKKKFKKFKKFKVLA